MTDNVVKMKRGRPTRQAMLERAENGRAGSMTMRVSTKTSAQLARTMQRIQAASTAEVLRKLAHLGDIITEKLAQDGTKLQIVHEDGSVETIHIV